MSDIVEGLLWGIGGAIILVPLGIWLYHRMKNKKEKQDIAGKIERGEFLTPMDEGDYDSKAWRREIDTSSNVESLKHLAKVCQQSPVEDDNVSAIKPEVPKNDIS